MIRLWHCHIYQLEYIFTALSLRYNSYIPKGIPKANFAKNIIVECTVALSSTVKRANLVSPLM